MRRTKTKALPSNGLPNNWQTVGEVRLPSPTRTRRRLVVITHALVNQAASRLNCLENMLETTVIRGKCSIFDKLQSTCLPSWSRSLPTPILRPPETEPPSPEHHPFRPNVGENKHPGTKRWSAPCAWRCVRNRAIMSKTPTAELQHQYLSFSQFMCVCVLVYLDICLNSRPSLETITFQ